MSSAPTQIAVAPTTASLVSQPQIQKDYLEEPISRQNSLGNRHRGGSKGKHLTRSHAMRESTSPPRTPTPRSSELITSISPTGGLSPTSHDSLMDSRLNFQPTGSSSTASSPLLDTSSNIHHSNNNNNNNSNSSMSNNNQSPPQIFSIDGGGNQSQLDLDFPKLTPPKSKSPRNNNSNNNSSNTNNNNNVVRESDKAINTITSVNASNGMTTNTEQQQQQQQHHMNNKIVFNNNSVSAVDKSPSSSSSMNVSPPTLVTVSTISTTNTNNINNNNNNCSTQVNDSSLLQVINNSNTASSQNSVTNSTNVQLQQQQQLNNSLINVPSQQQQNSYDNKLECHSPRDNSNTRNDHSPSNHSTSSHSNNNSGAFHNDDVLHRVDSPNDYMNRGACGGGGGGGGSSGIGGNNSNSNSLNKKHRTGANTKSSKPRLKTMGSSSSVEGGNNSSGFISRDSSTEQFTDQSGVDLIQFFKETLNKNAKDRNMLMRIEKELLSLALDRSRNQIKFPAMSSYNRMLIHRVAAYFGMEHNVDATQQSVIAAITKSTRVPEVRFKSLIRETFSEEPRKSILKRDAHSFDECRHFLGPDRGVLDRKAKSFEEREEEYEKAGHMEEHQWPWSSSDSSETNNQTSRLKVQNNRLLKVQSVEGRQSSDGRPSVSKSHSFGGYGGQQNTGPLHRGDSVTSTKSAGPRLFTKQDSTGSTNTPWRLSPSSSGYKTQSIRSDSVTPSPTGYGSGDHTPEPSVVQTPGTPCGVVWAVTDMASVPRGSVLIDPQTLQPLVNQDGTIYHFDPSNLPPKSMATKPPTLQRNKFEKQKSIKSIVIQPHNGNECDHNLDHKTDTVLHNVIDENVENISVIDNNEEESQIEAKENNESTSPCINEEIVNSPLTSETIIIVKQQKSQATSPNLPHNIPEFQPTQHNEISTNHVATITTEEIHQPLQQPIISNECVNENTNNNNNMIQQTNNSGSSNNNNSSNNSSSGNNSSHSNNSNSNSSINDSKKEVEYKTQIPQSAITIMSYAPSYQGLENGAVFQGSATTFPAYQQGADGSVYALQQPMMYAYPPTMESEVPGYFVPFYDQSGTQGRDGTTTLIATQPTATTIYPQPTAGTTAVVPLATYPPPLYQGQVVYAQEQFTGNPANGQLSQYPISYPVNYPYSYNGTYQGYWGQPMTTYYVPQTQLTAAPTPVSTPMIVQQQQAIPTAGSIPSNANAINQSSGINNHHHHHHHHAGKRGSPPQTVGQAAQYATHSAVQIPIGDPTSTMYAIPPLYPSMLPYTTSQAAAAVAAGVLTQLPHQQSTVINSVLPSQLGGPPPPQNSTQAMEQLTSYHQINTTNSTPQSTPSTPLSLPLSHHPQKNQPIFATPPTLIPNGYTAAAAAAAAAQQITGCNEISTTYERKTNSTNSANTINRRTSYNNPNAINTRPSSNPSHQAGGNGIITGTNGNGFYATQNHHSTGPRKYDGSSNNSTPRGNNNTNATGTITQKRETSYKPHHNTLANAQPSVNQVIPNHTGGTNSYEKIRGPRPKPANLDLRRNNHNNNGNNNNNSNRNTPSTNSTESNNSPNSITSNNTEHQTIYMTTSRNGSNGIATGGHLTQFHQQQNAAAAAAAAAAHHIDPCHQQLISTYNPTGMYVKFGQYFTHPSMALPSNRRSPPTEIRPQLTPITGMYPMNVMLSAQRHITPRPQNPNYKGNKPR